MDPDNPKLLRTVQNLGATGKVKNIEATFPYTGSFALRYELRVIRSPGQRLGCDPTSVQNLSAGKERNKPYTEQCDRAGFGCGDG
jgi:hypothetical protein